MFQVDRECYVIYLGTEGHDVRPFLRIGTTTLLPEQIKRHIGAVVISDRFTGNFFSESACIDPRFIKHLRYVGTRELVDAVKDFSHRQQVSYVALKPVPERLPSKGGQVVFFDDGNLRVFLDGHRLFDLTERERADRHDIFRLTRLNTLTTGSRGAYRKSDFQGSGFITDGAGAVLTFADGRIHIVRLAPDGAVTDWPPRAIPLSLLHSVSADVPPDEYYRLYRFRMLQNLPVPALQNELPGFTVFKAGGIKTEKTTPPALPHNAPHPGTTAWVLPGDNRWQGDTEPPLLPGVPYHYTEYPSELEFRHLMTRDLQNRIDQAPEPEGVLKQIIADGELPEIDRQCAALWLWNRTASAKSRDLAEGVFAKQHIPVIGLIRSENGRWHVRFRPRAGLTRSAITDNERARQKMEPLLAAGDETTYRQERERLTAFLQELIAAGKKQAQPAPAPHPPPRRKTPDRHGSAPRTDAAASAAGTPGTGKSGAEKKKTPAGTNSFARRRRMLVAAIVVALLLVLGFGLYRVTGFGVTGSRLAGTSETGDTEPGLTSSPVDVPVQDGAPQSNNAPNTDGLNTDVQSNNADDSSGRSTDSTAGDTTAASGPAPEPAPAPSTPTNPADTGNVSGSPTTDDGAAATSGTTDGENTGTTSSDDSDGEGTAGGTGPTWSVQDILRVTNWIAGANGYRPIGADDVANKRDPDWIFPDNEFTLPNGVLHTVVSGDTLWSISVTFLNDVFLSSNMELSYFRDLIDSEDYPVEELESRQRN